jgi:uncharacterized membrane protein
MKSLWTRMPAASIVLLVVFLLALLQRGQSDTTQMLIVSSVLMFAACGASAAHLLGPRAALKFIIIGLAVGWFAEQMGASRGWFFGEYTYTDVLGPRLGEVPMIIPLMWFALCYGAYVISNLIVLRSPSDASASLPEAALMSLLSALIVTAYDLGADPYMVFKLKAWIMTKTDGWWFGETLQGFFGWAFIAFVIIFGFRMLARRLRPVPVAPFSKWHALVPLLMYTGSMLFQMAQGVPVETRTIALFAMGIPLLCAVCGFSRWSSAHPEHA